MTQIKTTLSQVLLEVPAVVLAVFLALAVNNCNEEHEQQAAPVVLFFTFHIFSSVTNRRS